MPADGEQTRSLTAVTAVFAPSRTTAVAARLRQPRLHVRWRSSTGSGMLFVEGSTNVPARARIDMRRPGGGPLATLRVALQGGSFRRTLSLREGSLAGGAEVFPGGFTVALTGRTGRGKLPLQLQTIAIGAPDEGVVRKTYRSRKREGAAVVRFPAGTSEVWANFRFEKQPKPGPKLTVRWYWPNGRRLGDVDRNNRSVVSSYMREGREGAGIPRRLWVAEIRAGSRVVHRLSVRIGGR